MSPNNNRTLAPSPFTPKISYQTTSGGFFYFVYETVKGEDIVHTFTSFLDSFMSLNLTEIEIAWITGLFEGEANFGLDSRSKKRYDVSTSPPGPFVKISMVDQDVIEKVAKLLNKSYFSPSRKTSKGKTVYTLHIGDRTILSYLLPRLFPYLGERRQKIVQQCIDALTA